MSDYPWLNHLVVGGVTQYQWELLKEAAAHPVLNTRTLGV